MPRVMTAACSLILVILTGCGSEQEPSLPVQARHADGSPARMGLVVDGARVGTWEERRADGSLRSRAVYRGNRLHTATLFSTAQQPALRVDFTQGRLLVEAFDDLGTSLALVTQDGSRMQGDPQLAFDRLAHLPSDDLAQQMRLAVLPVGPVPLAQAAWQWWGQTRQRVSGAPSPNR